MKSPRRLRPFVSLALVSVAVLWSLDRADSADPASRPSSFDSALERLGIDGHGNPDAIRFDAKERAFCGAAETAGFEFTLKAEAPALHLRRKDSDFGLTLRMKGDSWKPAEQKGGMVVYAGPDAAAVYRPTNDGVKEDVVVRTAEALQRLSLSWNLDLSAHLEARLLSDGSIGIYGPDTFLWGAISTQDDSTAALIEKARRKAPKNQLLYRLPKPQIVDAGRKVWAQLARYTLQGKTLAIELSPETAELPFPISIDPTVVLTLTADFLTGNSEGDISISGDQLTRASTTSGRNGSWSATTSFTMARSGHASVAYNGYVYVIGGGAYLTDVQVAAINADGTVGTWTTTTSLSPGRTGHAAVAYNGYLYILGGDTSTGYVATVQVSKIGSSGTLGAWSSTSSFSTARTRLAAVAHNGYLYVLGGQTTVAPAFTNNVQFASIKGDGTLGAWAATASSFTLDRGGHTAVAHKGFLYVIGGQTGGASYTATVYYAPVASNGDIAAWYLASSSLGTAVSDHTSVVYNGYLYAIGGTNGTLQPIVQFAPLLGYGGVGGFTSSTGTTAPPYSLSSGRSGHSSVAVGGRLYVLGGTTGSAQSDVLYSTIQSLGTAGAWTTDSDTLPSTTARRGHTCAAYLGYLYVIGGYNGTTYYDTVHSALIGSDGTIGAFSATTSFTTGRYRHASVVYNGILYVIGGLTSSGNTSNIQYGPLTAAGLVSSWTTTTTPLENTSGAATARRDLSAVAYRGNMYVIGGDDGSPLNTVQYMAIQSSGDLTSTDWTTATALPETRIRHASVVYGGYLYVIGGFFGDYVDAVYYAAINSSGSIGTWSTTTVMSGTRAGHTAVAYNGYLFVMGGENTGGNLSDVISAPLNSNGTVGTWVTSNPAFATARNQHASVVYEGFLFIVGGWNNSTYYDTVQSAPINVHGTTGTYTATTALPGNRYGHAVVVYNGYLYLLGGYDSSSLFATVHYAAINPDGTIGAWTATSGFSTARYRHAAVVYNGYLYVLGGESTGGGGGYLSDVQYAAINSNGTVGAWATTTAFTTGRGRFGAAAYRGFLYVLAGSSGSSLSDVQVASLNSNGTVGTFQTTTALPSTRYGLAVVAYNGYLYATGGFTGSYVSDILYSAIGAGGLLGAWNSAPTFQRGRWGHTAVASNGFLYIIGGYEGNAAQPDVQYAPIQSNGTVGCWHFSRSLTSGSVAVRSHASAAYEGRLFVLGGLNSSNSPISTVVSTPLNTPLQSGAYSRLIDLGSDSTVNSILLNGSSSLGTVRLQYRLAPSSTAVFGSESASTVTLGSSVSVGASARYAWLRLFLDDGASACVNPDATNARDVTDLTVDYGTGSGSGSGSSDDDKTDGCLGRVGRVPFSGYLLWLAGLLALLPLLRRRG